MFLFKSTTHAINWWVNADSPAYFQGEGLSCFSTDHVPLPQITHFAEVLPIAK